MFLVNVPGAGKAIWSAFQDKTRRGIITDSERLYTLNSLTQKSREKNCDVHIHPVDTMGSQKGRSSSYKSLHELWMVACFFQTRQGEILKASDEHWALPDRLSRDGELSNSLSFLEDPVSLISKVAL